jgi:hypothetical protein
MGNPSGSGTGLILDPWAGSRVEILAHLLIGHRFAEFDPAKPGPIASFATWTWIRWTTIVKRGCASITLRHTTP